jgi:hypothetical protein
VNRHEDDFELRRQLRQLSREVEPGNDLWAGIEARIDAHAGNRSPRRVAPLAWAVAASVLLTVFAVRQFYAPELKTESRVAHERGAGQSIRSDLIRRQAEAITIEYRLALEPFAATSLPAPLASAAGELDASAVELLQALRQQPDASYLLDRLRRTYDQRLKLAQRAELG